jgi:hypothetical protein
MRMRIRNVKARGGTDSIRISGAADVAREELEAERR